MLVDGDKPTGKGNYDQEGTKRQREGEGSWERERERGGVLVDKSTVNCNNKIFKVFSKKAKKYVFRIFYW